MTNPTPYFIAFDPGENVGIAEFDSQGTFIKRAILKGKLNLRYYIQQRGKNPIQLSTFIVENFRLFPGAPHKMIMNTLNVVRCIGEIEALAWTYGIGFVLQEPSQRTAAEKWLGFNYKSHTPDDKAAHAHGVKYLVDQGIITVEKAVKDNESYQRS